MYIHIFCPIRCCHFQGLNINISLGHISLLCLFYFCVILLFLLFELHCYFRNASLCQQLCVGRGPWLRGLDSLSFYLLDPRHVGSSPALGREFVLLADIIGSLSSLSTLASFFHQCGVQALPDHAGCHILQLWVTYIAIAKFAMQPQQHPLLNHDCPKLKDRWPTSQ